MVNEGKTEMEKYHVQVCVVNYVTGWHYWFHRAVEAESEDDALEMAKATVRLLENECFSTLLTKTLGNPPMTAIGE